MKLDTDDEPFPTTHLALFRAKETYIAQSLGTNHFADRASFAHSSIFASRRPRPRGADNLSSLDRAPLKCRDRSCAFRSRRAA